MRRIYFTGIQPAWLRELAKRWARWRITSVRLSPAAVAGTANSLRAFSAWLAAENALPAGPQQLTRTLLERYLTSVHLRELSTGQKQRLLGNLRTFLNDVRMHGWEPGLAGNATYFDGEIPRASMQRVPRYIDEFVMSQIEREDNLARLPDLTTQTAIIILIETGLRSVDAVRLAFDPVTVDEAGAPYLLYTNHKLAREAVIPISQRLLEQIRRQQADVAERFAAEQRHFLLPRTRANQAGEMHFSWQTQRGRLQHWLADCDIRDAVGQPVHVTPHQFRHTLATRLINHDVPLDRTLPNGYCGLPLQQSCPHPNACLTCDGFLTTTEFLPAHRQQLHRTEEPLDHARTNNRQRLVDMNEPIRLNLIRVIEGLQAVEETGSDDGA